MITIPPLSSEGDNRGDHTLEFPGYPEEEGADTEIEETQQPSPLPLQQLGPQPRTLAPRAERQTKTLLTPAVPQQPKYVLSKLTSETKEVNQLDHTLSASTTDSDHTPPTLSQTTVFGLYEIHNPVAEIKEVGSKWNEDNIKWYTLAR
ncbi:hypothetical protein DFP73DRAFT_598281 [Morchella snyderi]|nr:hypothetical protein DFP73DRAFT_598281 [Morchella snyderi]